MQVAALAAAATLLLAALYTFAFGDEETLAVRLRRAFFRAARAIPFVQGQVGASSPPPHIVLRRHTHTHTYACVFFTVAPPAQINKQLDATRHSFEHSMLKHVPPMVSTVSCPPRPHHLPLFIPPIPTPLDPF